MDYKRLELYVGWTCNQKCTYCIEFPNMEKSWYKKVTDIEILKKLIKYKKLEYNHVTFLGGEPFIQKVFLDALIIGKKLWYTILVTTNCTTLHIDSQVSKFLPYIDELFLSIEAISVEEQQKISRTKNYVHWEKVFVNINKYGTGKFLKANIVVTQDNKNNILNIFNYLCDNGIKNISITYPDIDYNYYGESHIKNHVAPMYKELIDEIIYIYRLSVKNKINIKFVDFPFCVFPNNLVKEIISHTDDVNYSNRIKITYNGREIKRDGLEKYNTKDKYNVNMAFEEELPRERFWVDKCINCIYNGKCWGPSIYYNKLYGLDEINPIN